MKTQTPTETNFALVAILWVAGLCAAAQFAKIGVIFPELLKIYPDAGASAGFLLSLLSFFGMVMGVVAGILVARFGFRAMLLSSLVLGAAMSAFQVLQPSLSLMLASRLVEGASHLGIVVAAPTLIAQVSSNQHRAAAMTLWGTFFGVAFALVAWLGLPLVKAYGPSSLFAIHAALMAAVAALLSVMLPRTAVSPTSTAMSIREILDRHSQSYASAFISAPAMGWLFYTLSFVSLITVLPSYVSEDKRALVIAVMPLATTAASLTLGVALLRRLTAIQVVIAGFALSLASCAILFALPGSIIGCLALFAALGLVQGASFAAVPELNADPQQRALANGAMAQMGNLGNLTGTPLLLFMLGQMGFNGLVLFAMLCYSGGMAMHMVLAARRKRIGE